MSNKLKYLDKKGLAKVLSLLKFGHKKIWHGTLAEWEALSATEKAKYDQAEVIDEYTGVPVVVDKVESGNLNPVTSNAVAEKHLIVTGSATPSPYVTEGSITYQWMGRVCRVLFEGVKLSANMPFLENICSGLPPSNGTEFLPVVAEYPSQNLPGFLRADRGNGLLKADAGVGGNTEVVTLYASVTYLTMGDAHN